jgi:hypothetical protein
MTRESTSESQSAWFMIRRNGVEQGPFDHSAVSNMISKGKLRDTDMVRRSGSTQWVPGNEARTLLHDEFHRTPKRSPRSASSTRGLNWVGVFCCVLAVCFLATIGYFAQSWHARTLQDRALNDLRSSLMGLGPRPSGAEEMTWALAADQALRNAKRLEKSLDPELQAMVSDVSREREVLTLHSAFDDLVAGLRSTTVPQSIELPATGMFASDPIEADIQLSRLFDGRPWIVDAVKQDKRNDVAECLDALIATGKMRVWQRDEIVYNILPSLGHPRVKRALFPNERQQAWDNEKSSVQTQIADFLARSEKSPDRETVDRWRKQLAFESESLRQRFLSGSGASGR